MLAPEGSLLPQRYFHSLVFVEVAEPRRYAVEEGAKVFGIARITVLKSDDIATHRVIEHFPLGASLRGGHTPHSIQKITAYFGL
jgi:hypothetical protein